MRSSARILTLLVLGVLAALVALPAARAEEEPKDDSPATKAYRDAWWAETAGGNLSQALELYGQAVEATGPATVRARALFRRAVVWQRLGKTEDAIRALERLSKDFPGEAALQGEARARLAEWTAVDLRTSFGDWFKRYQYSPEFQGKVVEIVRRLGLNDQQERRNAQVELLTIGEAALPALRAHLDSKNVELREAAVQLVMTLGEIPPAAALRASRSWTGQAGAWAAFARAPRERREAFLRELTEDHPVDHVLRAYLGGPVALLAWARTAPPDDQRIQTLVQNALAQVSQLEAAPPLIAEARTLLHDGKAPLALRLWAAGALGGWKALGVDDLERMLGESLWPLRERAFLRLGYYGKHDAGAWALLLEAAGRVRADADVKERSTCAIALLQALTWAPDDADLDAVARLLIPLRSWPDQQTLGGRTLEVAARVFERAPDAQFAEAVCRFWRNAAPPPDAAMLARARGWLLTHPFPNVRDSVADYLIRHLSVSRATCLALVAEPTLAMADRGSLWNALTDKGVVDLVLLDAGQRRALLGALRVASAKDPGAARSMTNSLFRALQGRQDALRLLASDYLDAPDSFPDPLTSPPGYGIAGGEHDWYNRALPEARAARAQRWPSWTWDQRTAALQGELNSVMLDAPLQERIRASLRDPASGASAEQRRLLLKRLSRVDGADLSAAVPLATPQDVDAAVQLLWGSESEGNYSNVGEGLFELLRPALRPDGPAYGAASLAERFKTSAAVQPALTRDLLAHADPAVRSLGLVFLQERLTADDLPLWLLALEDAYPTNRIRAAKGLARLAHPDTLEALGRALNDPIPNVRDAVAEALKAITELADLKSRYARAK